MRLRWLRLLLVLWRLRWLRLDARGLAVRAVQVNAGGRRRDLALGFEEARLQVDDVVA